VNLRWRQVGAIGRHIAAALDDLANELGRCHPRSYAGKIGSSVPPLVVDGVTIAALFVLKNESSLQFQWGAAFQNVLFQIQAFPSLHMRRPGAGHPGVG